MVKKEKFGTVKVKNKITGVIREAELTKVFNITEDADKFFQMYYTGVTAIMGIEPYVSGQIFMYLCSIAIKNKAYVTKSVRKDIVKKCNISESTFFRAVDSLYHNGLLNKQEKGVYEINAWYAWDGDRMGRNEMLHGSSYTIRIDISPDEELYEVLKDNDEFKK